MVATMTITHEHNPMTMAVSIYKNGFGGGLCLYLDRNKGLDSIPDAQQTLMEPQQPWLDLLHMLQHDMPASTDPLSLSLFELFDIDSPAPLREQERLAITLPDPFLCFNDF